MVGKTHAENSRLFVDSSFTLNERADKVFTLLVENIDIALSILPISVINSASQIVIYPCKIESLKHFLMVASCRLSI